MTMKRMSAQFDTKLTRDLASRICVKRCIYAGHMHLIYGNLMYSVREIVLA